MPLKLPNLDDRRYKDLVEEARSLIPAYAPEWTNHNPSDPGISLVELFAHLTEIMLYRLNRVTDENRKKYLKLLNGPDWTPGEDLADETVRAVEGIREIYRAVTCRDYEDLVTEQFKPIARARCVARRYLDAGTESGRLQPKPGHLSVIIVPGKENWAAGALGPQPTAAQLQAVWAYLDERRTLTTRHHVVGPLYAPVGVEGMIVRRPDVSDDAVLDGMLKKVQDFFYPLPANGKAGWPFGRDVYVSEVCEALESVEGVDYVPDLMLTSACDPADEACVAAESVWHDDGDLIGLAIPEHQLPAVRIDSHRIVIVPAAQILVVSVTVNAVLVPSADPVLSKRKIKQAVRRFFHPLYDGPKPTDSKKKELTIGDLISKLTAIAEIQQIDSVSMQTDPSSYLYDGQGRLIGVKTEAGAGIVIDARLRLNL
jgi:hypothetical protein